MGPALDYHPDGSHEPRSPRADSASGFTDALGERSLEFDLASGTSVERLRFAKEFAESPVFESAVRDRIERFEYFRHPAIATVRSITRQPGGALILESKHTAGRRLSDIGLDRNAALALDVIRQLTPALVALHEAGDGVVHGLFGPERVVVTREGRLMLVEHVLGGAMVSMRMPSHRMRADFGLALPDNQDVITLDQEDDLTELGLLALSLLVGRRVTPSEYPDQIEALVSESAKSAADLTAEAAWVRRWIERAVHVGPNPFRTAREAVDTIGELGERGELRPVGRPAARPGPVLVAGSAAAERFAALQRELPEDTAMTKHETPASTSPDFIQTMPIAMTTVSTASAPAPLSGTMSMRTPTPATGTPRKAPVATAEAPRRASAASAPARDHAAARTVVVAKPKKKWLMPTLISLAAAQALIIGGLMIVKQSQTSASDAPANPPVQSAAQQSTPAVQLSPAPGVPLPPAPLASHTPTGPQTPASPGSSTTSPAGTQPPAAAPAEGSHAPASTPAAGPSASTQTPGSSDAVAGTPGQRIGGVKVTAPFELQVFENGKLLGVTAGPIALVEGPHALDLVNDSLEFKVQKNATVKPGQITSVTITLPQGRLSVNAVPWAEVLIDGADMGQTPLANLPVTIGQHEVIFRHPQLGEQKQTVVVKATTPTRISVTFPK